MRFATFVMAMAWSAACAAQMPSGAHSVDDTSRQDAINAETRAAESLLEAQDYKGAEAKLKALLLEKPHDTRVLYDLGFAQEANGESADAAKSYAGSIAAEPKFAEPKVALGLLDAREGRVEAAHKELLDAAELTTADPALRGRSLRALAHLDLTTHPDAAREELLAAVKLTGETQDDIAMSAAMADHAGDSSDAEAAYRRALRRVPGDVDASTGLAHALQKQGKTTEAEAILNAANQKHPDDPRIVAQLVPMYANSGRAKDAIALLLAVRAKNPGFATDQGSTRLLARLYAMTDDNADASVLYLGLVQANPNDPALMDDFGGVLVKQQRYAEAEGQLSKAVAMRAQFHDDAAWGEAAGHLAFAASKNGHPQSSLQALAARATVLPNTPSSLFLEAIAHDALKQNKEAVRAYRAFLAVSGGKYPDEEFKARHRLVALVNER